MEKDSSADPISLAKWHRVSYCLTSVKLKGSRNCLRLMKNESGGGSGGGGGVGGWGGGRRCFPPPMVPHACTDHPPCCCGFRHELKQRYRRLLLLWLFLTRRSTMRLCQRHWSMNCASCGRSPGSQDSRRHRHPGEPSTTKNSSSSRARKTGAQLWHSRRSAKNDAKCVKKPIIAAISKNAGSIVPVCVAQLEGPRKQAMNCIEAPPRCNTMSLTITGMSTTLSRNTCGISTDFSTAATAEPLQFSA